MEQADGWRNGVQQRKAAGLPPAMQMEVVVVDVDVDVLMVVRGRSPDSASPRGGDWLVGWEYDLATGESARSRPGRPLAGCLRPGDRPPQRS